MTGRAAAAIVLVLALARAAGADGDPGDTRFRAATLRAAADPAGAAAELVAIADELPDSIWADDALVEAAAIAERGGDRDRAIALLRRVVDHYPASRPAAWARRHADELAAAAGDPAWTAVAAEHDAVIAAVGRAGDPAPALARLAVLLHANPGYPRGASARIWLADRWCQQGAWDTALGWYRDAAAIATSAGERRSALLGAAAALTVLDRFADADAAVTAAAGEPGADPIAIARARDAIATGRSRHLFRIAAWVALGLLAIAAALALRRNRRSTRAALAALARPPIEAWFLVPVAALVIAMSAAGNSLVAGAVVRIAAGGVIVTWVSGAVLTSAPALPARRIAVHVAAIAIAAAAIVYLAVSRDGLLDLLIETWRGGPEAR